MPPGSEDDESAMRYLVETLDIQSAATHLRGIGFSYLKPPSDDGYHLFTRKAHEALIIAMQDGEFTVACKDGIETIRSWDHWVDFIRAIWSDRYISAAIVAEEEFKNK